MISPRQAYASDPCRNSQVKIGPCPPCKELLAIILAHLPPFPNFSITCLPYSPFKYVLLCCRYTLSGAQPVEVFSDVFRKLMA